jgi:hypothetical protein
MDPDRQGREHLFLIVQDTVISAVQQSERRSATMAKVARLVMFAALAMLPAMPAAAQTAVPDLRGTWKGESESILLGGGNPHHAPTQNEPHLRSVTFTLTVDNQDGRRFSGTFSSARSSEKIVAVISRQRLDFYG